MVDSWSRELFMPLTFKAKQEILSTGVATQMKPLQQYIYFYMELFIQYVVLAFESLDEILWCYHSNGNSLAVLSHGTIYLVCRSNF